MIVVGIDVGLTGALAAIDGRGGVIFLADLPIASHGKAKWVDGVKLYAILHRIQLLQADPPKLFVEHIHAMPDMGTVAANSKGMTLGSVLAIVGASRLPFQLVAPVKWKRAMGLLSPGSTDQAKKLASLEAARKRFPTAPLARQKDNGRAEALLLAAYGLQSL